MTPFALLLVTLAAAFVSSCTSDDAAAPHATQSNRAPDSWVGRWEGPEGTYLDIAGGGETYSITIKDLDRSRTFTGAAVGDRIEFERDGVRESLRATNGDDTGMKWLISKADCLTIKLGEGFCRD